MDFVGSVDPYVVLRLGVDLNFLIVGANFKTCGDCLTLNLLMIPSKQVARSARAAPSRTTMNLNGMKNLSSRLQRTLRSGTACV
jgi:hypothetical protein